MGWLKNKDDGKFTLGPNIQDFLNDKIPDLTGEEAWADVMDNEGNGVFWDLKYDYLVLSMACHWQFSTWNNAFRTVVGNPTHPLQTWEVVLSWATK